MVYKLQEVTPDEKRISFKLIAHAMQKDGSTSRLGTVVPLRTLVTPP